MEKGKFSRGLPTVKSFVIANSRDFDGEKKRILENLDEFFQKAHANKLNDHPGFGKFSKADWSRLQFVHIDHHLQQFSA
jgi:hypothetical protein